MIFHRCLSQNVKIYDIQTTTAQGVKTQLRKYVQSVHFIVSRKTCHGGFIAQNANKRQEFRM